MHDPQYAEEAIERARRKLRELRTGTVVPRPAGAFWGRIVGGGILVLLGLCCLGGAAAIFLNERRDEGAAVGGAFLALIGLGMGVPGLVYALRCRATTPQRALLLYYKAIGGGKARRASTLLVPNDIDDFPRFYPEQPDLGRGGMPPYAFGQRDGFAQYWRGLVRYPSMPYCLVQVKNVRIERVDEDTIVAEFDLKLAINTSLWMLFILVALIIALIVDLATRKNVHARMRKVMIRVGDEWHLFSGEWQGPDEEDIGWLDAASAR